MKAKILIVDDEIAIRKALIKFLMAKDYKVDGVCDGAEAIEMVKNEIYDLVISDLKMPNMSGIELIRQLRALHPNIMTIIMTGFGTIESAVEAVKEGAFHYITKPFELDDVSLLVEKALSFRQIKSDNEVLKKQVKEKYNFENIIGCSDNLKEVFEIVKKVSETDSNILIRGDSGTGKELIARAIHYNSKRAARPLIPVNCGAIPENLLESELFGYMKGAFTGAVTSKTGKFEAAQGGTIFLDEIGDMSLKLQVKILRVLQEKKFEPVGSTHSTEIDVRVIAATHHDLETMMEQGKFREDLYYRLNVIPVVIPPLCERIGDVPLLINHFMDVYTRENKLEKPCLSNTVIDLFMNYKWPGNIRELENTIERLVVLKPGTQIEPKDLPEKFSQLNNSSFFKTGFSIPEGGISLKNVVEEVENALIRKALDKTNWNKNKAAHLLHLNRTTLVEKIKKKKLIKPRVLKHLDDVSMN